MGESSRPDLELEQELEELYRNVSGSPEGASLRKGKPPGVTPAARRRRSVPAFLAAAGLLAAAGALFGVAFLAWHDGNDGRPAEVILRITGLKGEGASYLVDKQGRRYRVPAGAVILPLEASPGPSALTPAEPAPRRLAEGIPISEGGGGQTAGVTVPREPAAIPASPPAPPALSGQREERREEAASAGRGDGAYAVQVRAYPEDRKAEALAFAQELRRSEEVVAVETVALPGRGVWHRVLVGSFAAAEEADDFRRERLAGRFPLSFVQRRAYFSQRAW